MEHAHDVPEAGLERTGDVEGVMKRDETSGLFAVMCAIALALWAIAVAVERVGL
jgi:hypothetical protein